RFGPVTFELGPHLAWLWADAVGADPAMAGGHPTLALLAAQRCAAIDEVLRLVDGDPSTVRFAALELTFDRPLIPGRRYTVDGKVTSLLPGAEAVGELVCTWRVQDV